MGEGVCHLPRSARRILNKYGRLAYETSWLHVVPLALNMVVRNRGGHARATIPSYSAHR